MKHCNAGKGKVLTLRSAVYHKKAIEFAMHVRIHVCDNTKLATSNAYCIVYCVCVCVYATCGSKRGESIQADMAAPQVTQVAPYRLCINDEGTPNVMPGCVCEAGANCNTDHSMVRAKLVIGKRMRSFRRVSRRAEVKR